MVIMLWTRTMNEQKLRVVFFRSVVHGALQYWKHYRIYTVIDTIAAVLGQLSMVWILKILKFDLISVIAAIRCSEHF